MPDAPKQAIDPDDWAVLWRSELAALAVDPEWHERVLTWGQAWVGQLDAASGGAGTDASPGPPPAGAASELERELDRLRRRVADLEHGAEPA